MKLFLWEKNIFYYFYNCFFSRNITPRSDFTDFRAPCKSILHRHPLVHWLICTGHLLTRARDRVVVTFPAFENWYRLPRYSFSFRKINLTSFSIFKIINILVASSVSQIEILLLIIYKTSWKSILLSYFPRIFFFRSIVNLILLTSRYYLSSLSR